jgi:hypothetical protein
MMHAHHTNCFFHSVASTSDWNVTSRRIDIGGKELVPVIISQYFVTVIMTLFINDHFSLVVPLYDAEYR